MAVTVLLGEGAIERNDHESTLHSTAKVGDRWDVIANQDRDGSDHKIEGRPVLALPRHGLGFADSLENAVGKLGSSADIVVDERYLPNRLPIAKRPFSRSSTR